MKPKFFFDYIFYRVTQLYLGWEGSGGITTGSVSVTGIQGFTLGSLFVIVARIFYERIETAPYAKKISSIGFFLILALSIWNHFRYNKEKYEFLKEYWKDESVSSRKLKGFLVVLSIILPMMPIILVGVYW